MKTKPCCTFEIYQSRRTKQWFWRCRNLAGNIVADSGKGYYRHGALLRSLQIIVDAIRASQFKFIDV